MATTGGMCALLTSCYICSCFLVSSADFFQKITFSKSSFRNTIRVSNGLDADQDQLSVGPDLSPNCLQRLSTDGTTNKEVRI